MDTLNVYPAPKGLITGLPDEDTCHCCCGARGFRKAWGTRANGDRYNGCTFCTGEESNADNENGTDVRGIGHLPWAEVDNLFEWATVPPAPQLAYPGRAPIIEVGPDGVPRGKDA